MRMIGRVERVDLPDLGLSNIEAKIDTGAYGNALHCHHINVFERNDEEILRFKLLDPEHPIYEDRELTTTNFSQKSVKSSSGESELRYTIKARLMIFDESHELEFSLTDRNEMKYPILLGRTFLSGKFTVDVQRKNVSYKQMKRKK
jgi:hypothetical protein